MTQLPSESLFGDYAEWPGRDVLDSGGARLGGVREIYLDRDTGQPEWVLVDVEGDTARFVPLADATVESTAIRVAHTASTIRNAPGIGAEARIDQSEERRLYAHYGLGYSEQESDSGLPADEPPAAGETAAPDAADAPSSWSDVAPADTNDAPPPAEPPSATELEKADIPEPPAMTDRAFDTEPPLGAPIGTPGPAEAERDEPAAPGTDTSSTPEATSEYATPGEPATTEFEPPPPEPAAADLDTPGAPEPAPPAPGISPPAVTVGPTESLSDASPPVTPDVAPTVGEPAREPATAGPVGPPPSPADAGPRTWTPPPEPEPSGGALAVLKSRPGGIAAGVVIAAVLLLIIRKLR